MAPKPIYASPGEQNACPGHRRKSVGFTFDEWWEEAMRPRKRPHTPSMPGERPYGAILWPSDNIERTQWRRAIEFAEEAWRRFYEGLEPEPGTEAVGTLLRALREGALSDLSLVPAA